MNIEIADRLVKMRKKKGYSQEELADKLGLSRQAVSKWERAEASPDTDNLICLAKLYGVSLDELLNTEDDVDTIVNEQVKEEPESKEKAETAQDSSSASEKEESGAEEKTDSQKKKTETVNIDKHGIHVLDNDGSEVHVGFSGIHIKDADDGGKSCSYEYGEKKYEKKEHTVDAIVLSSLALVALVAYLLLGFLLGAWYNAWVVFFIPEIIASFIRAIRKKKFCVFNIAFVATFVFFFVCMVYPGMGANLWYIMWVVFLAIPIYYTIFHPIDSAISERHEKSVNISISNNAIDNEDDEDENDEDDEDDEKDEDEDAE